MEAKGEGRLRGEILLDVRHGLLVVQAAGRGGEAREVLDTLEELLLEVGLEVHRHRAPVPVLDDVTTVHDLADDVLEVVPRDLAVVLQVVVHALAAAQQIARVERVVHVPPDARRRVREVAHPELLAL